LFCLIPSSSFLILNSSFLILMKAVLEIIIYVAVAAFSAWLGWAFLAPALGAGGAAALGGAVGGLTLALWDQQRRKPGNE
jgi:membrane associated rhomboid family serine protease